MQTQNTTRRYVVNYGYDSRYRPRNRYFATIEEATAAVGDHFRRYGVILAIEETK